MESFYDKKHKGSCNIDSFLLFCCVVVVVVVVSVHAYIHNLREKRGKKISFLEDEKGVVYEFTAEMGWDGERVVSVGSASLRQDVSIITNKEAEADQKRKV